MIRPLDLQNAIVQSMQSAAEVQRAEDGPRLAAQAVAAQFVADLTQRDETVAPAAEVMGNRVEAKSDGSEERRRRGESGGREPNPDACGPSDDGLPHLIDVTA